MNDVKIRQILFKNQINYKNTSDKDTIVIEELGINHGKYRADIAVLNSRFIGYEIKSNKDSLTRLSEQIKAYNSIFDKVYIVIGHRHEKTIQKILPNWWGIIVIEENKSNDAEIKIIRDSLINNNVDPLSIAKLLWKNEVVEILKQNNIPKNIFREPKAILYEHLLNIVNINELKNFVKYFFSKRNDWRCHDLIFQYDDLCQPSSM